MCEFLSFCVTKEGKVLTLLGEDREKVSEFAKDSHSAIAECFGVNEDETWKFQLTFNRDILSRLKGGESLRDIFPNLRDNYDGGLDIAEFSEICEQKVWLELAKLRGDIIKTASELFKQSLLEQILGNLEPAQFIIELSKARAPQELFEEITSSLSSSRRGFIFDHQSKYDYSLLSCFHFDEYGNIAKIFVHRFIHEFAVINDDGSPVKRTEFRVYIYPIAYALKEGEEVV